MLQWLIPCMLWFKYLLETPHTVVDPSFYGSVTESEPKCMIHTQRTSKMVAFEGTLTRRRFLGCCVDMCDLEI